MNWLKRWWHSYKLGLRAARGPELDRLAALCNIERLSRVRRDWRFLWLRWRDESDTELRLRMIEHLTVHCLLV